MDGHKMKNRPVHISAMDQLGLRQLASPGSLKVFTFLILHIPSNIIPLFSAFPHTADFFCSGYHPLALLFSLPHYWRTLFHFWAAALLQHNSDTALLALCLRYPAFTAAMYQYSHLSHLLRSRPLLDHVLGAKAWEAYSFLGGLL